MHPQKRKRGLDPNLDPASPSPSPEPQSVDERVSLIQLQPKCRLAYPFDPTSGQQPLRTALDIRTTHISAVQSRKSRKSNEPAEVYSVSTPHLVDPLRVLAVALNEICCERREGIFVVIDDPKIKKRSAGDGKEKGKGIGTLLYLPLPREEQDKQRYLEMTRPYLRYFDAGRLPKGSCIEQCRALLFGGSNISSGSVPLMIQALYPSHTPLHHSLVDCYLILADSRYFFMSAAQWQEAGFAFDKCYLRDVVGHMQDRYQLKGLSGVLDCLQACSRYRAIGENLADGWKWREALDMIGLLYMMEREHARQTQASVETTNWHFNDRVGAQPDAAQKGGPSFQEPQAITPLRYGTFDLDSTRPMFERRQATSMMRMPPNTQANISNPYNMPQQNMSSLADNQMSAGPNMRSGLHFKPPNSGGPDLGEVQGGCNTQGSVDHGTDYLMHSHIQ